MEHVVTRPRAPFPIAGGRLEVHQVPSWRDNLIWLLVDPGAGTAVAVDGPEVASVDDHLERHGLRLVGVLNTHTHPDHIGINRALAKAGRLDGLRVVGAEATAKDIPGLGEPVADGDTVEVAGAGAEVIATPGHIDGHISFHFEGAVFCGDTLFGAGCGYLFDGPPAAMHHSLQRLVALPDDTLVCCAHEYTEDNLRFAWTVDPDNPALAERIRDTWVVRSRGECTVPSTIALERATNPFLRTYDEGIRARLRAAFPDRTLTSDDDYFAATRALKDRKDYKTLGDDALPI